MRTAAWEPASRATFPSSLLEFIRSSAATVEFGKLVLVLLQTSAVHCQVGTQNSSTICEVFRCQDARC
ncbi:uncharacterized protein BO95DRAFT_268923 [Aspergillus brunneoviolaceus CBS 621.78]|uniref:Uncharacterized protein n=1 Tax=Aspergillus brunneoviolaceus CBS 621.78 TaxID=1450534 RepID=A0ACD1GKI0_9EURO|nr:hypothetical protein BO95DRAFT_268923 [Aspergillus brunneoviolaceus CBS 621.78]RAH49591.1 hypothetical protein BO95DRAFT_268923 [Aspergillus brunneoviolaceus CBS 621.78]